jgi:hypothetical protein
VLFRTADAAGESAEREYDVIQHFLSAPDAERTLSTLRKLARHNISRWALTGGFAVEIHHLRCGRPPSIRPLNDLDFIADGFDCIPETLADEFLFQHVHPLDPPGKTILQFIHADTAIRVDLFRVLAATMSRAVSVDLPSGPIQLISIEDLVARTARLVLDLAEGVPVASKHAVDYMRLVELVDPSNVEAAWQDHRRPTHPRTFYETAGVLQNLISTRSNLLVTPEYSKEIGVLCPRCVHTPPFQRADAKLALSLLGHC